MDELHTLIFMGLKHCGKSTLGRSIAGKLNLRFEDLDHLIMKTAENEGYGSIRELYRTVGIENFQVYETEALHNCLRQSSKRGLLMALGGGTVENSESMGLLGSRGYLVYISVDEQVLFERIRRGGIPPFLEGERGPREMFHALFERRSALFQQYADLTIALPDQSIQENTELIYSKLKEETHVR